MKIGELAKHTTCEVETIRYYERQGLLPAPPRTEGNYRHYSEHDAERLLFIRHCRSLGISLDDIRTLQQLQASPEAACDDVNAMLDKHLQQTEVQLRALERLRQQLQALRNTCNSRLTASECGILRNLQNAASANDCACHDGSEGAPASLVE